MEYVSGEVFTVNGFERGYLGIENHKIIDRGKSNPPKKPIRKGLIVPTLVNAHTHIGDSFIRKRNLKLPRNVEDLVAPPDGLKHRLLKETSDQEIIGGMRKSIDEMTKTGISYFCDFRENGLQGIDHLKKALEKTHISPVILSRPNQLTYNKDEIDLLLKNSQGIGLSSITDWEYSEIEKIAMHTKKRKKTFAIHASERIREDIELILDLKPNFLVHMVKATESDLIRAKNANIPIAVCPRSNAFFGLKPNIKVMKKIGIDIMIGTDNAMLNSPSVLDEIRYMQSLSTEFTKWELLQMITYIPRKALNLYVDIPDLNSPAEFVVLDKKYLKTLYISTHR
jgi:cytosine/adenosine deaminase-related metal-dependent hydrolase